MSRRQDVPKDAFETLIELHMRLRMSQAQPSEVRLAICTEARAKLGDRGAQLAWAFLEANIPLTHLSQSFSGTTYMSQNTGPVHQSVTNTAGGNQNGLNNFGTQTIRDITIFSQDLNQAGSSISTDIRNSLIETRSALEASEVDPAMKSMIVEQFDKMTDELKKGDNKNPGIVSMLWNMVYGAVKSFPAAVTALSSLDKLKSSLGL